MVFEQFIQINQIDINAFQFTKEHIILILYNTFKQSSSRNQLINRITTIKTFFKTHLINIQTKINR